jgi:hypothetical protein
MGTERDVTRRGVTAGGVTGDDVGRRRKPRPCAGGARLERAGSGAAAVIVVALAFGVLLAAPAHAAEAPKEQPIAVVASGEGIAPGAPAWVRQHVSEVLSGKRTGQAAAGSRRLSKVQRTSWIGCKTVWAYRGYNHWLGYTLFRYYQQVSWCSNGYGIYSYARDRWPETHVGWRFNGHIGSSITGGSSSRSAWTQGSFSFCVGSCYDHKYPWVLIDVNYNGGWNAYAGG